MGRFIGSQSQTKKGRFLSSKNQESDNPGLDFNRVAGVAGKALINPTIENIAQGAGNPVFSAGQSALNELYGQSKTALQSRVSDKQKEVIGDLIQRVIPLSNLFKKRDVGNAATGFGIDAASTLATEGTGIAAKGLSKMASGAGNLAEEVGGRALNFYIKPRQTGYAFGRKPGKAVVRNIGPTLDREGLFRKINSKTEELLDRMELAVQNSDKMVDITPVKEHFNTIVSNMSDFPETYSGPLEAHQTFARDLDNLLRSGGVVESNGRLLVPPTTALKIKRGIGKLPSWSMNDPKLGSLSKTARETYGAFDKSIDKAVPENAQLNQDISGLIGASQGIEKGMMREQNKSPIGLFEIAAAALGGAGNVLTPQAIAAAATVKGLRSAPFNTAFGATAGGIGKTARASSAVLDKIDGPNIIKQLSSLLNPKTRTATQKLLTKNDSPMYRATDVPVTELLTDTKQLPFPKGRGRFAGEISGPTINAEGIPERIQIPQVLDSDMKRLVGEYGVPEYGGPRSTVKSSEIPVVDRGKSGGPIIYSKKLREIVKKIIKRRKSNFGND